MANFEILPLFSNQATHLDIWRYTKESGFNITSDTLLLKSEKGTGIDHGKCENIVAKHEYFCFRKGDQKMGMTV